MLYSFSSPRMVTLTSNIGRKENSKVMFRSEVVDVNDVVVKFVSLLVGWLVKCYVINTAVPNLQSHGCNFVQVGNWN